MSSWYGMVAELNVPSLPGSDSDSSDEEMLDISTPEVLAKYRLAAEIANRE